MIALRVLSTAVVLSASLVTTVIADTRTFMFGFEEACFGNIQNLDNVMPILNNGEWQRFQGADEGEYEFVGDTTHIFLNLASDGGECTVVDPDVSEKQAAAILEAALDDFVNINSAQNWSKAVDDDGENVWQLDLGNMFLNIATVTFIVMPGPFYQTYGQGSGAAISFRITQ